MGGPGPGTASQALLISPPDAVPPRGSGVRSGAHFTCGWVRISICSASAPHRAVPCSPPPPPPPSRLYTVLPDPSRHRGMLMLIQPPCSLTGEQSPELMLMRVLICF